MNPLLRWQLEQIEKECGLLQGHATDPDCPCETDTEHCQRKHLLMIEALAEETYPMAEDEKTKGIMTDLADQARAWRKQVEQLTVGSAENENSPGDNPQAPVRTERGETRLVKVFKEASAFHAGSLRTIKPREDVIAIIGCPIDTADWIGGECLCHSTGERGCTEIHSLDEPIIQLGG